MPGSESTVETELDQETVDFLDGQAEALGTARAELLQRLVAHYRTACQSGLSCPHCKNELLIDL